MKEPCRSRNDLLPTNKNVLRLYTKNPVQDPLFAKNDAGNRRSNGDRHHGLVVRGIGGWR